MTGSGPLGYVTVNLQANGIHSFIHTRLIKYAYYGEALCQLFNKRI